MFSCNASYFCIFLPILFCYALWQKHSKEKWLKSTIAIILVIFISSFIFHPKVDFINWLFHLYKDRILPGEIGDLTANAFNFWWLVNPRRVLDTTSFFGISARIWGVVIVSLLFIPMLIWLKKNTSIANLFLSLVFGSIVAFIFLTRIHPRYLYPFFPLATILIGIVSPIQPIYAVLSVTHLVNIYYLFWAPSFPILEKLYDYPLFPNTLAVINIIMLALMLRLLASRKI